MILFLVKIEREYIEDGDHLIGIFETLKVAKESLERFIETNKKEWIDDFAFIDKIELNKLYYYDKKYFHRYSKETIFYAQIDLKGELIEIEINKDLNNS